MAKDDGIRFDGPSLVSWRPAVVPRPAALPEVLAMDEIRAVAAGFAIGPAGQPLVTYDKAFAPRLRDRILIDGVDFTYFRDRETVVSGYDLVKPLLWGSATIVLPQVSAQYDVLGDGATVPELKRIRRDAEVLIQRVNASNVVVSTAFIGFIDSIDTTGNRLSLVVAGLGSGRCARQNFVPSPPFRRKHDLAYQILDFLRRRGLVTKRGTDINISMFDTGGVDGLSHINELSNQAIKADGTMYDVMPTGKTFDVVETDRETVDFTVYFDDNLVTQQLSQAFSEEIDEVYATARTRNGELISFLDIPGLYQGPAPDYPGSVVEQDDTGDAVTLINNQLTLMDFLDTDDMTDESVYTSDTTQAVTEAQIEAGWYLQAVAGGYLGKVNEDTWDLLWNLQRLDGYSIDRARQRPAAFKDWVPKWNRMPNGGKLDRNKKYDPHRVPNSVFYDLGAGFTQRRTKRLSKARLTPDGVSNWVGTMTIKGAVIRGEHTPGDPITADDVMPREEIKPGMNGMARYFDGDTLLHVSGSDVSPEQVVLKVDTQARDTITVAEIIGRRRETRGNIARQRPEHIRASTIRNDVLTDWSRKCGRLAFKVPIADDSWTEVVIPAGQTGIVQQVYAALEIPAEFALLLTQKQVSIDWLNDRIPTPLTDPRPDTPTGLDVDRPWWERELVDKYLRRRGLLEAWGTEGNPCGYGRSPKTDDKGATARPLVGWFRDVAPLDYTAANPGRLYLYFRQGVADNFLLPGRILTQQLTSAI
jgi:hypothetical protein